MFEYFVLAGTTAQSSSDHLRGIIGLIAIPVVIIIIALIGGHFGKKKRAKFVDKINSEHPFKESYNNVHITEDGLLIIESINIGKVYNSSCLVTYNNNNKGFLALVYKLSDIGSLCPYTHTVRLVNKYGHGNQQTTTYVFNVLNSELDPIVPETTGSKRKLSKSEIKKINNGSEINGGAYKDDHDLKEIVGMIQRNAPHIQIAAYDQVEERKNTRNYMAKK